MSKANDRPIILLVGHCMPDMFMLRSAIRRHVRKADVETANSDRELEKSAEAGRRVVLLVNRQLDGRFSTISGIDLIRRLREAGDVRPALLVSNYDDAQQQAIDAGALPGFGKRALYDATTGERLRAAINADREADGSALAG